MKHRASREAIYKQVRKDTKDVCSQFGFSSGVSKLAPDLATISNSLRRTIESLNLEFARDKEEVKDAFTIAETEEDYLLCVQHWIGRLMLSGRTLGSHTYQRYEAVMVRGIFGDVSLISDYPTLRVSLYAEMAEGNLCLTLRAERYDEDSKGRELGYHNKWRGKPSRVIGKVFGEKFTTYMCQHYPIKANKYELHFSRHYLPELYRYIAEDENHTSCMSKDSEDYGLPDHKHPILAYEGSPNAVLALLWDSNKERYTARAIANIEERTFNTAYGSSGCSDRFEEMGLEQTSYMEGLQLVKKYWGEELLVPYVDGNTQLLHECENFLTVDPDGEIEGSYETGRQVGNCACDCCGERYREEEMRTDWEGDMVCESCAEDNYSYDNHDELVLHDQLTYCDWAEEYYITDNYNFHEVEYDVGAILSSYLTVCTDNWQDFINNFDKTIIAIDGDRVEEEEAA